MTRLKILISGGGVAGHALAFWLSKLDHNVTIVERFPNLRATGLQIDLRGYGVQVLRRMGLEEAFRSKAVGEQGWEMVDSSGKRRAYFPANRSGKGLQSFTTDFEIMRGDLVSLMHEAVKGHVEYIFGTSIEKLEQNSKAVEVRFANGKVDHFDLVVGADGQWSRTRRMMLGPDVPDALYPLKGMYVGYFTTARPIQDGEEYIATSFMAPGSRGIMTRRHNSKQIQVYLGCTTSSTSLRNVRHGDVKAEKEALADIFRGAGWQTENILEALMSSDDFYCERMALVKLDSWSKGRVVLVGDAAYCPTANTGMGTSSAMVGAYVLAGEISKHCDSLLNQGAEGKESVGHGLRTALESYEHKFRPFMDQVQKGVLEDKGFYPESAFGVAVLYCIVGIASFLRFNIAGWVMKEKVTDWELPEYKEMSLAAKA